MKAERLECAGPDGQKPAARLDLPEGPVHACALFAHCFACGKGVCSASRIAPYRHSFSRRCSCP